jgi:hypothetical protein
VQLSTCLVWVRTPLDRRWSSLRTPLDMSRSSLRTCLRCREGGGLGRTTTSLLLRSLQIQSLDQLSNQSVRVNHYLCSQSIMVVHANTNCCTHLSCSSWEDTTFRTTGYHRKGNVVLGNLIRLHYLGEVTQSDGTISPATCWDDYNLALDAT